MVMNAKLLRDYISALLQFESKSLDEFSGAGAIAGYVLPLGATQSDYAVDSKAKKGKQKRKKRTK